MKGIAEVENFENMIAALENYLVDNSVPHVSLHLFTRLISFITF